MSSLHWIFVNIPGIIQNKKTCMNRAIRISIVTLWNSSCWRVTETNRQRCFPEVKTERMEHPTILLLLCLPVCSVYPLNGASPEWISFRYLLKGGCHSSRWPARAGKQMCPLVLQHRAEWIDRRLLCCYNLELDNIKVLEVGSSFIFTEKERKAQKGDRITQS